jgi:uncharacterized membrane protein YqjE
LSATNPNESIATALQEVSDNLTKLVQDEIALAKAEVTQKVTSLATGGILLAVAGVIGLFSLIYVFLTIAWGVNAATGSLWIGFLAVTVLLLAVAGGLVLFGIKKLKVGAPTPTMAIDEAKKIRETVATASTSPNGTAAVPATTTGSPS